MQGGLGLYYLIIICYHWRLKLTDKITFSTLFHFLGGLIDSSTGTRLRIQPADHRHGGHARDHLFI